MDLGLIFGLGLLAFLLWIVADNLRGEPDNQPKVFLLAGVIGLGIWVWMVVANGTFPR